MSPVPSIVILASGSPSFARLYYSLQWARGKEGRAVEGSARVPLSGPMGVFRVDLCYIEDQRGFGRRSTMMRQLRLLLLFTLGLALVAPNVGATFGGGPSGQEVRPGQPPSQQQPAGPPRPAFREVALPKTPLPPAILELLANEISGRSPSTTSSSWPARPGCARKKSSNRGSTNRRRSPRWPGATAPRTFASNVSPGRASSTTPSRASSGAG
jgi:hypothetical protein